MKTKIILFLSAFALLMMNANAQTANRGAVGASKAIIGMQVWSTKNLDVSAFRNGDSIPQAKTADDWADAADEHHAAWCYYYNDDANGRKYGKLYNWYAITDPRGIAPQGWHLPTDTEWAALVANLGGDTIAGFKLKSTFGWHALGNGSNKSGFNALPGGCRQREGNFDDLNEDGYFWSASEMNAGSASAYGIDYTGSGISRTAKSKGYGFSCRCVKDN